MGVFRRVVSAVGLLRVSELGVRHSVQVSVLARPTSRADTVIQKDFGQNTRVSLTSRMNRSVFIADGAARMTSSALLVGAVRHQFSPRLSVQASAPLLQPSTVTLSGTYAAWGTALSVETYASPALLAAQVLPPAKLSLARQLYPDSATQGVVTAYLAGNGSWLSLQLVQPRTFSLLPATPYIPNRHPGDDEDGETHAHAVPPPPSTLTALGSGALTTEYTLLLAGASTRLGTEATLVFAPLAVEFTAGAHALLTGVIEWSLGATWRWRAEDRAGSQAVSVEGAPDTTVSAAIAMSLNGVILRVQ
jgi:hypothetical protein